MTLKGIPITLISKIKISENDFGEPVYEDVEIEVNNVLIGQPSTDNIVNSKDLYGKKLAYTLAIPKGDTNNWENVEVRFFGEKFRTIGSPIQGIEKLIPLDWNKKVMVERYE